MEQNNKGKRFNEGKLRYDLLEPYAIQELTRVFTKGAEKYEDNNWLKGMTWRTMLASLKRHIAAFEQGEDFDAETGCYHMAHAAWNALALVSYYKYHPDMDNRLKTIFKQKRIGLDVDEVLADFVQDWCNYWKTPTPHNWNFDRNMLLRFKEMGDLDKLNEFYLRLKPLVDAKDLPFEPVAYITSRPIQTEITAQWLDKHNFPSADVFTVSNRGDKVQVAKELELDYFIDDNYDTFREMNDSGICCFLMDAEHNRKYDVGFKRIANFNDFKQRFL